VLVGHPLADGDTETSPLDGIRAEVQRTGNTLRCTVTAPGGARHGCVLTPRRSGGGSAAAVDGVVCTFDELPQTGAHAGVDPGSPVFAHAPIGMGLVALDGTWFDANQALCALTGHDRARLRTMTVQDVTVPEDRYADFVYQRQLLAGELTGYQLEKRWQRADGHEIWVLLAVSPVGPSGEPDHLLVQVQDITARKEAEDRASMLADLVDCSGDAIWARDGGGEVVFWNRAAAQLLGYVAADLVGPAAGADLPDSRVAETAHVLAIAAGGRSVGPVQTIRRHKDGHDVDVSLTVSPIVDRDGGLLGFASVARDVTERRRDEARLRRADEDLRQVIRAVAPELPSPLRTRLVEALARYERSGVPSAAEPVALDLVVAEVLDGFERPVVVTGARIAVGALPVVEGDRVQLSQAIHELVANAFVHAGSDDRLVVRVTGEEDGDWAVVHVDDNGPGIAAEDRDRVFGLFTRLDDERPGSGVGLTLVQRIADGHHGEVTVGESPLGGTRVTLRLSRAR
jgi:PAS domain S-box-containing protein